MDSSNNNRLLILYGIEKGYIDYLPTCVPAVRDVNPIFKDIFDSYVSTKIRGFQCLNKIQLCKGIHHRVIKLMGDSCVSCETSHKKGMNVHHIKPYWRTWNNVMGFTVLCPNCHRRIRGGLDEGNGSFKAFCEELMRGKPAELLPCPENPIVKVSKLPYYYLPQ